MDFSFGQGDDSVYMEEGMNVCPICKREVSNFAMANGDTKVIECFVVHNNCLKSHKDSTGRDWTRWEGELQKAG